MNTPGPEVRILRALSGLSRAERDLEALGEAQGLTAHLECCLRELTADTAYGVRRLANMALLAGLTPRAIEKAKAK
jgi:hypothetical protein